MPFTKRNTKLPIQYRSVGMVKYQITRSSRGVPSELEEHTWGLHYESASVGDPTTTRTLTRATGPHEVATPVSVCSMHAKPHYLVLTHQCTHSDPKRLSYCSANDAAQGKLGSPKDVQPAHNVLGIYPATSVHGRGKRAPAAQAQQKRWPRTLRPLSAARGWSPRPRRALQGGRPLRSRTCAAR